MDKKPQSAGRGPRLAIVKLKQIIRFAKPNEELYLGWTNEGQPHGETWYYETAFHNLVAWSDIVASAAVDPSSDGKRRTE